MVGQRFSDVEACAVKITAPADYANVYFEVTDAGVTTANNFTGKYYTNTSAAATLTLAQSGFYSFSGTTATWSLPTIAAGLIGTRYEIKNRGSGNLTVDVVGGGTTIYDAAAVTSIVIPPGDARTLIQDSTYWNVV